MGGPNAKQFSNLKTTFNIVSDWARGPAKGFGFLARGRAEGDSRGERAWGSLGIRDCDFLGAGPRGTRGEPAARGSHWVLVGAGGTQSISTINFAPHARLARPRLYPSSAAGAATDTPYVGAQSRLRVALPSSARGHTPRSLTRLGPRQRSAPTRTSRSGSPVLRAHARPSPVRDESPFQRRVGVAQAHAAFVPADFMRRRAACKHQHVGRFGVG